MKEKLRIALFDLDIIAYRAAAAIEKRTVEVRHTKTDKAKIFKTRTEFKEFLAAKNIPFIKDDYTFTDIQTPEPEEHAFQIVKVQVNTIKQEIQAKEMYGYVGGKDNFRLELELPVAYKGQREDMLRPVYLTSAKEYAINKYPGGIIHNVEADDQLVIVSHELIAAGHDPVIITLDKDSKGCVGTKYYDWTQPNAQIIEVPAFGHISYNEAKKKVEGIGLHFYCYQLLQGDTADNYTPRDLHNKNFGDRKAVALLSKAETIKDLFDITAEQFDKWFPSPLTYTTFDGKIVTKTAAEVLELYHQCAYMKRKVNDTTTFEDLRKEFS